MSLDIKGACDKIWWDGLLHHLWIMGIHQKALKSYLSNHYLFIVANGKESSLYLVMIGVPQGGVWSPLLFNLYVRHLPSQLESCLLVSYADDYITESNFY